VIIASLTNSDSITTYSSAPSTEPPLVDRFDYITFRVREEKAGNRIRRKAFSMIPIENWEHEDEFMDLLMRINDAPNEYKIFTETQVLSLIQYLLKNKDKIESVLPGYELVGLDANPAIFGVREHLYVFKKLP